MNTRRVGRIAKWKDDRGFGFIRPRDGDGEIFVHISAFSNRSRRPIENAAVSFMVHADADGRPQAQQVRFVGDKAKQLARVTGAIVIALSVAGIFLTGIGMLADTGRLPPTVLTIYLSASVVTFIAYAWDKSSARNNRWRTKESTLLLLGLSGGWPGGWVARHIFRHKSKKQSFIFAFWVTVAINLGALAWLLSPQGQQFLASSISLT